jgi:uncharacterized protein YndB with AHSA1/START domain
MSKSDFTTSFTVDQPPDVVFAAITNVRGWWSGDVEGETNAPGATFTYRHDDVHYSKQRIAELAPGRRVVWHVEDARLNFTSDPDEWVGTDIIFEIIPREGGTEVRFTHQGLISELECYESCSGAWAYFVSDCLQRLITTGAGQPDPGE